MSRTRESQRGGFSSILQSFLSFLCSFFYTSFERNLISGGCRCRRMYLMLLAVSVCCGFTPVERHQIAMLGRNLISPSSQYLFAPHFHSLARRPLILLMPSSGSGALEFLFTNKQISLCIWVAPPLLPLSPAAGEAGRKFSMKQRRHAARWLTSGAQGHWCWLEKANTIFYWSNSFRSKFGVKHPDRSKYSPFIPINNAASIFGRVIWTKNIKHGLFVSTGVAFIYSQGHFESTYGWIHAKERSHM